MRSLAEQALILGKLFTNEQLQLLVSNHIFKNAGLIGTSSIIDIKKSVEANKLQSATSNYDSFPKNSAPESAPNNDVTELIESPPISAFRTEREVEKNHPVEPKKALIEPPQISTTRPNGGSNMARRLAEMGKKP
jgi:hypothetical protein